MFLDLKCKYILMRFTINQHHMYELRNQLIQGCTTT